ncbi:protein translocase subunit yidC [Limimonas halophila]|uniref:Membrane protein insertase YidC n=1 Tax=Limimonas halophila TaxID=1082479 RepID=A0A1G7TNQ6_9PROT|nr:membrane protein insertase YidC [Limimonas halophila]SDG36732.1 protein translocase subunit yidC [Limimonas halophila]
MEQQRNLLMAIVLSVAILLGFELLYRTQEQPTGQDGKPAPEQQAAQSQATGDAPASAPQPDDGGGATADGRAPGSAGGEVTNRANALDESPRVAIDTPKLDGSISLVGGRIDDLTLRKYRVENAPDSPKIDLLSPPHSENAYYASFGWVASGGPADVPGRDARWEASADKLTVDQDVTLTWTGETGLRFERTYSIDEDYMFEVTQRVTNEAGEPVSLAPYGLVSRRGTPDTLGYYILHEGPIGVYNGTLDEIDYDDVREDGPISRTTTGGWTGITDKYWLVSLVPDQDAEVETRFVHTNGNGVDKYQADYLHNSTRIAPGEQFATTNRLFAGAKEVSLLDGYAEDLGIPHFDKAVDFGWLYFLTKPVFHALDFFAGITGNFGVAIILLVLAIKLVFFPLANKSYRSMAKMRKLQPEMQRLREQFGDDKQRLNQEMMALYKREGANPASGCLPILVQIPFFFAVYKVLFVTIEMRHAPFMLWLDDLSAKDPTSWINLFGLLPYQVPNLGPIDFLSIGILPIIMGITMYAQQALNPQPADATQARIFKLLPIVFTFLLAQFPSGLVVYWTSNNIFTFLQQYIIMRRAGMQIGGKMESPAKPAASTGDANGSGGDGGTATAAGTGNGEAETAPAPAAAQPAEEPAQPAASQGGDGGPRTSKRNPAAAKKGGGKGRKGRKR